MSDHEARFREPKTVYEERELVEKAIPSSTKYKNKWAVTIFGEWQMFSEVFFVARRVLLRTQNVSLTSVHEEYIFMIGLFV